MSLEFCNPNDPTSGLATGASLHIVRCRNGWQVAEKRYDRPGIIGDEFVFTTAEDLAAFIRRWGRKSDSGKA